MLHFLKPVAFYPRALHIFCEILDHITTMSYHIMLCFAQKICFVVNFKGLIKDSEKYFFQFSYDFVRALVLVDLHCKQNFFKICHVHLIYLLVVSIGILMMTHKKAPETN